MERAEAIVDRLHAWAYDRFAREELREGGPGWGVEELMEDRLEAAVGPRLRAIVAECALVVCENGIEGKDYHPDGSERCSP